MGAPWRTAAVVAAVAASLAGGSSASAYEFELRARTIGQIASLLGVRFTTGDLALGRRRFTQTLALDVWDLGRGRRPFGRWSPDLRTGPRLSFTTYLRLDHDFGEYTSGVVRLPTRDLDAVDQVPELEQGALQLDVLYAYFAAEDLAGGALDVYAGRQLIVEPLELLAFDGVRARGDLGRLPIELTGFAGLRVREASPLGGAWVEPDGTSGGECQEYVEGVTPGSGAWRPIDLRLTRNTPFRSDLDRCPQREQWMPVYGVALASAGGPLHLRIAYRRALSPTPYLIGPVDRFDVPDRGYYPDEVGQAPAWGTNEEVVTASARAAFELGPLAVAPHGAARYSLLHGLLDEVHAGVRLVAGRHAIEPEVYYVVPTFDGDSIFNVFSSQPYVDGRVTYSVRPADRRSAYLRGWLRRFASEDAGEATPVARAARHAGGAQLGGSWRAGRATRARAELFVDGGYGGRRRGGHASGELALRADLSLSARASLIHYDEDSRPDLRATSVGLAAGATYRVDRGIAVSLLCDELISRRDGSRFSALAVLDLAFQPEL